MPSREELIEFLIDPRYNPNINDKRQEWLEGLSDDKLLQMAQNKLKLRPPSWPRPAWAPK